MNFSGKLPGESVTAAKSFIEKVMDTRAFNWLTGFAGEHNVAAASLIALFLAGGLRPAITISLPGDKDLEDKIYAAGHSLASAIIGFGFSTLITTPIDAGIKYIFKDAKKMRKEDYDNLTVKELAELIRKNNLTPEKIADIMKSDKLSKEDIIKQLYDENGKVLTSEKIAEFVKSNNGQVISLRNPKNRYLTIVSEKIDKVNELKHKLAITEDLLEKETIPKQIKILEKHIKGIDTTMHNISEWAIAIPRSMLTIALIPPILKYVFHVEKGKKLGKKPSNEQIQPDFTAINRQFQQNILKPFATFKGGNN